jgi:hypothetical protein
LQSLPEEENAMLPIPELAAATVANLAYLSEIPTGNSSRVDRRAGTYRRLRSRLTAKVSDELLSRFEEQGADDVRNALRQALKERLVQDPGFRVELDELIEESSPWP